MTKIHVNAEGESKQCHAEKGGCPYGAERHFDNEKDAQAFAAQEMERKYGGGAAMSRSRTVTSTTSTMSVVSLPVQRRDVGEMRIGEPAFDDLSPQMKRQLVDNVVHQAAAQEYGEQMEAVSQEHDILKKMKRHVDAVPSSTGYSVNYDEYSALSKSIGQARSNASRQLVRLKSSQSHHESQYMRGNTPEVSQARTDISEKGLRDITEKTYTPPTEVVKTWEALSQNLSSHSSALRSVSRDLSKSSSSRSKDVKDDIDQTLQKSQALSVHCARRSIAAKKQTKAVSQSPYSSEYDVNGTRARFDESAWRNFDNPDATMSMTRSGNTEATTRVMEARSEMHENPSKEAQQSYRKAVTHFYRENGYVVTGELSSPEMKTAKEEEKYLSHLSDAESARHKYQRAASKKGADSKQAQSAREDFTKKSSALKKAAAGLSKWHQSFTSFARRISRS